MWDYKEAESFSAAMDTIIRVKSQHAKWEKIFTSHTPDTGLVSSIGKEQQEHKNKQKLRKINIQLTVGHYSMRFLTRK